MNIILASASPRRKQLLTLITPQFDVVVPQGIDERAACADSAVKLAGTLAKVKCRAVSARHTQSLVLGCDTVVQADGNVLGKPSGRDDAARMLRLLSNRAHNVHTGVCLRMCEREYIFVETTEVVFAPISEKELAAYLDTSEPYDKAGAYGIQGSAARFVRRLNGCYFNVMGLPVSRVYQAMQQWCDGRTK